MQRTHCHLSASMSLVGPLGEWCHFRSSMLINCQQIGHSALEGARSILVREKYVTEPVHSFHPYLMHTVYIGLWRPGKETDRLAQDGLSWPGGYCYELNCVPQNSYVEIIYPNVSVFEDNSPCSRGPNSIGCPY